MTTSTEVPGRFEIAIDGRPFQISFGGDDGGLIVSSVPVLRNQSDSGARPGEQSLSPDDLWRRSVESWHHGAGQSRADRENSDPYRFRASLHADVFTKYRLGRLSTVEGQDISPAIMTHPTVMVADDKLWLQHDQGLLNVTDNAGASGAAPLNFPVSAASDGHNIYTAHDVEDIYKTTGGVMASYIANGSADLVLVRWAKGRLLAFDNAGKVYNPTTAGALPAALFTHPLGSAFHWTDATEGERTILMCGYAGTGSEAHGVIYYTTIKADGTALDVPVVAARLPDGEQALAICGYLGFVLVGTSLGVRVCKDMGTDGLSVGPLIETGPCHCFEPQGSQVWFGWSDDGSDIIDDPDGDNDAGGLGRIDLSEYTFGDGAPAYANDLKVTGAGVTASSVVTYQNKRAFTTSDDLFIETGVPQSNAYLASGQFAYDLTEPKVFHYLAIKPEAGSEAAALAYVSETDAKVNDVEPVQRSNLEIGDQALGVPDEANAIAAIYDLGGKRAESAEYLLRYTAGRISRVTLLARPAVNSRSEIINVSVVLRRYLDVDGQDVPRDPEDDEQFIRGLVTSGAPVDFQKGAETYKAVIEDHQTIWEAIDSNGLPQGVARLRMKRHDTVTTFFRSVATETADGTSITLPVPDGALEGDRLYAVVAWPSSAGVPAVSDGWTMLSIRGDDGAYSNVHSATFGSLEGTLAPLTVTFAGAVKSVGVVAAYIGPDNLVDFSTINSSDLARPMFFESDVPFQTAVQLTVFEASAMLTAIAGDQETTDFAFTGPLRARARASQDIGGGRTLFAEIGDAPSIAKCPLPIDVAGYSTGDQFDAILSLVVVGEKDAVTHEGGWNLHVAAIPTS